MASNSAEEDLLANRNADFTFQNIAAWAVSC